MLVPLIIIALLIALNGIFVAAEFAIIGAPRTAIARLSSEGNRVAAKVRAILYDPLLQDRYVATAQLGITGASLGLGMYGEHVLAEVFARRMETTALAEMVSIHAVASVIAVGLLTYFHIVLGEMVPKSLALQYGEKAALWLTRPMSWIHAVFYPVVAGLNWLGRMILSLLGMREARAFPHQHTLEELQYIVQESQERGYLRAESGAVLQELLEFGELTAGEVMVPRVRIVGLPLDAPPERVRQILESALHTRYPVYTGDLDHIIGVLHIKDLLRILLRADSITDRPLYAPPYVPEATPLDQVLHAMIEARTQMVIVMDEHGGTAGIVTLEDLFEEVVGEIEEVASRKPPVHVDAAGNIHAAGTARLEELGDELDLDLEHDEIDTVSGLVLTMLGRPPAVGDEVVFRGLSFRVVRVVGRGVGECLVRRLGSEP